MSYFGPFPKTTNAYIQDASGNEYFGECAKGADVSRARWSIFQKQNTGGASNPTAWIILFPIDTSTGLATDEPKFIWSQATTGQIIYAALGMGT